MKLHQLCATMLWVSAIVISLSVSCYGEEDEYTESDAVKFLEKFNREAANWTNLVVQANWNWSSNLTVENSVAMFKINEEFTTYMTAMNKAMMKYQWSTYKDANVRRQFDLFSQIGSVGLPEERMRLFDQCVRDMKDVYHNISIPDYGRGRKNKTMSFDTDLAQRLAATYDPNELKYFWIQWTEKTGKRIKKHYTQYVKMSNEGARLHNFAHATHLWISRFEDPIFQKRLTRVWHQIRSLYLQLHAYARRKLWERYGNSVISRTGPIPAHLLGDNWSYSWEKLANFTLPYPDYDVPNLTSVLINQKYTPKKMFEVADEFMTSLNISTIPHSFWEKSILEKPVDRDMLCHASVWDFYDSKNFRIKQCTKINFEEFLNAHKEMAVLHYYAAYKDQPYIFRDGPIDGFQEAVGDTIALSVTTPEHLFKIGLLPETLETSGTSEADIDYLYKMALNKVAFMPYAYILDLWRWNVFSRSTSKDHYNCDWWDLRYKFQGLDPPVVRTEDDFDPGAKYHIPANIQYIKYFVSIILQFQFHQALCEKAGQYDPTEPNSKPLFKCNIYQSSNAGNSLKEMMELGKSKHWLEALEVLTGTRQLEALPLMNYFKPLHEWLKKENKRTGEIIGWKSNKTMCIKSPDASKYLPPNTHLNMSSTNQVKH